MTLDLQAWIGPFEGQDEAPAGSEPLLPDLPRGDERLRALVGAAASFPERADAGSEHLPGTRPPLFAPDPAEDRRSRAAAVETWLRRATGDPAAAGVLLDHLAATGRPLGDGLRKVVLRDPARLPDWAQALVAFLRAQPATPGEGTAGPGAVAESFRRAAYALLPHGPGGVLGVPVTDGARADLAAGLTGRLTEACNLSLCHEHQAASGRPGAVDWDAAGGLDASQEGWLARLERLPGLAYLVGVACLHWQRVSTELFARLAADRALLVERLWDGTDPGPLASVHGDAGDRHVGGRSVALLRFADGAGVVYKPKDMRHATAYLDLVRTLNAAGLPLDLPVRTVLVRSDRGDGGLTASLGADCESEYGWEELVPDTPCDSRDGFARFYRRLGMTIRLVQLLEGRDLWADNLLAHGEYPVITDLECLLYPRVQTPPALPAGQRGLLDELEATVVRTAMAVQPWVPSRDQPAIDIGCLSRAGDLRIGTGTPALPLPPYRPVHDGETADAWQYTDEVVAGYREMHRTLYGLRAELAAEDGPLAAFRGLWVRYIWRHTWDGYKIIRASTSPLALTDGATRETVIAGALRGAVAARAGDADRGDLLDVVLSELDAFRELDVPFFRSLTTSSAVYTGTGQEIPGHFQGTAWLRLRQRVTELADFDLDAHTAVLSGCLDAAREGTERPTAPAPAAADRTGAPGPVDRAELLERAVRIGDRLLTDQRQTPTGRGWIGLSWYPATGLRQVEILGVDLVSGSLGVGLLLAELWAATGEPRFHRGAHRTLAAAADLVDPAAPQAFAFAADARLVGGAPVPGGLAGPGALIHALARGGLLLAEPDFVTRAQALVPGAAALAGPAAAPAGRGRAPRQPYQDTPFGTAGLLLNLLRLRRVAGPGHDATDQAVRTLAAAAADHLAARGDTPDPARRPDPAQLLDPVRLLDLVPTGADSVAAALARAVAEAPALLGDADAARDLLRAHRFATGTRSGRLACLDTAVSLGTGAVHPADLGRLAAPVSAEEIAALGSRALVATAGEALTAAEAGLLHTLPDDAPALVPGPFFDGREAAGVLVGELLRRRRASGHWYGDRAADDRVNLGALDGTVAVGLLLLRLLDPATAPLATLR
ncbi:type 2 lanthipeptide synthetase LanM [Streptomyces sp. NPDC092296]|uniref:type 2 lanthipeptide synthetase LanM n=1 Tax=Streptomyces sp. NPDC092296 TaxID=3366012 RepID=UPI0038134CFC